MPSDQRRDLVSQPIRLRAASVDEKTRSVEAVLTTGNPVPVFDWNDYEVVDEVLLPEGAVYDDQMPMLESHMRWDTSDLLGSIRQMKREGDNLIVGRLFFVSDDPDVDKVWNKVRQGHLTDVSIGYQILESVRLEPNTKANIGGREFAAGSRPMRIATKYRIREGSVVVIGADQAAKIRAEHSPPKQGKRKMAATAQGTPAPVVEKKEPVTEPTRTEPTVPVTPTKPVEVPLTQDRSLDEAQRQKSIRTLAKLNSRAINDELVESCLDDPKCTVDMAADKFLEAHRGERKQPIGATPGSVNVKDDERKHKLRELSLAMCVRQGLNDEKVSLIADRLKGQAYSSQSRSASPLAGCSKDELKSIRMRAEAHASWSQTRLIERALEVCGVEIPESRTELYQRALSTSAVQDIFTTNVQASLLIGYLEAPDTTQAGFVSETDVDNYLEAEAIDVGKMAGMKKRTRGKPAEHADIDSKVEKYRVTSYSEQFEVDEMDMINDRFGAITQRAPLELGADASRLRPDLVYSTILANPQLAQDTTAVFHAAHKNLLTGGGSAMSKAALELALSTMLSQFLLKGKKPVRLNIRGRYVFVPTGMGHFTRELLGSSVLLITGQTDRTIGNLNALSNDNLIVIEESRLDATGCWDPAAEVMRVGSATNWFMASDQRRSLQVAYLRGTGRVPRLRSKMHDSNGLYGMQWDIEHSIGCNFLGYLDWLKSNGA
jgi:hypothetical protein